jgi:hypothetical protein
VEGPRDDPILVDGSKVGARIPGETVGARIVGKKDGPLICMGIDFHIERKYLNISAQLRLVEPGSIKP